MIENLEQFGSYIRRRREERGLTLDGLAARTGISKPYLSNIETARAPGPPSAEKVAKLEEALGFAPGELQQAADWLRTPETVRQVVRSAAAPRRADGTVNLDALLRAARGGAKAGEAGARKETPGGMTIGRGAAHTAGGGHAPGGGHALGGGEAAAGDLRPVVPVPLINRVAAGRVTEYTDLDYPVGVADSYVPVPEQAGLPAATTFALRVSGDSMEPAYREGELVIVTADPPKQGDVCLARLGPEENFATTLKRVEFVAGGALVEPEEAEAVRLVPLNPRHQVRDVPMEQVTGLFPVRWKMTAVMPPAPATPAAEDAHSTFDLAQD